MAPDIHPGDVRAHAIAQRNYFAEHGNWGYDPGDEDHIRDYFDPALALVKRIDGHPHLSLEWTGPSEPVAGSPGGDHGA